MTTRAAPPNKLAAAARLVDDKGHFNGKVHYDLLAKLAADDRRATASQWLRELADPAASPRLPSQEHALLDRSAADFTLDNHHGRPWNLQSHLARGPVVLVFYLGYSCPACVHDLVLLNADLGRFRALGAEIVAVSGDDAEVTREGFASFGAFDFPVLCDPEHRVARVYEAMRRAAGDESEEAIHATFVIARDGQVRWAYRGDTPWANNKTLLYEVARLENKLPADQDQNAR